MALRYARVESARDRVVRFLSDIGRHGASNGFNHSPCFRDGVHEDSQDRDEERRCMKVCEKPAEKEDVLARENGADGVVRKAETFFVANRKNLFYVHIAVVFVFLLLIAAPAFL